MKRSSEDVKVVNAYKLRVPYGVSAIDGICKGMTNLKDVYLSSTVKEIGVDCFFGCTGLRSLSLNSQITSIGMNAFSQSGLVMFIAPKSLKVFGGAAFAGCFSLKSVKIDAINLKSILSNCFRGCKNLEQVDLREVISIGDFAFRDCVSLKTISGLHRICYFSVACFRGCSALESVSLLGAEYIDEFAFSYCNHLREVVIGEKIVELDCNVFYNCVKLKIVRFEGKCKKLKTISEKCFANCASLEEIEIPESVVAVEECAFYNCSNLRHIKFRGKKLQHLDAQCFSGCTNLESIGMSGVSCIEDTAFEGCNKLKKVYTNSIRSMRELGVSKKIASLERYITPYGEYDRNYNKLSN